MMGFFLALIVIGGLGSLITVADPARARLFPLTLAMFFSGIGSFVFGFGLGFIAEGIVGAATRDAATNDVETFIALSLTGFPLGAATGAALGFMIGTRRNRRTS
jgi:hypothetical protein